MGTRLQSKPFKTQGLHQAMPYWRAQVSWWEPCRSHRPLQRIILPLYHQTAEKALQNKLNQSAFQLADFNQAHAGQSVKRRASIKRRQWRRCSHSLKAGQRCTRFRWHSVKSGRRLRQLGLCTQTCLRLPNHRQGRYDACGRSIGRRSFFINMGFSIFHAYPDHGISAPLIATARAYSPEKALGFSLKTLRRCRARWR